MIDPRATLSVISCTVFFGQWGITSFPCSEPLTPYIERPSVRAISVPLILVGWWPRRQLVSSLVGSCEFRLVGMSTIVSLRVNEETCSIIIFVSCLRQSLSGTGRVISGIGLAVLLYSTQ